MADGFAAVVVKGGHLPGPSVDVLVSPSGVRRFAGTRLPHRQAQRRLPAVGLRSTLATGLALGRDSASAVRNAKLAVRRYLA